MLPGVFQLSSLGLLLFLIYITVSTNGSALLSIFKKPETTVSDVNSALGEINDCAFQ